MLQSFREKFGPGFMFAALAVGISHLVQSTRAGADYGLTLGLLIIFVSMVKYPGFRFGAMYAAATGKSLLDNYRRQGRHATIAFILAVSVDAFIGAPAVTLVTAGLFKNILHIGLSDIYFTCLLLIAGAVLLITGQYRLLEKATKLFVVAFTMLTIIAAFLAAFKLDLGHAVLAAPVPFNKSAILFMIAVAGVMPTALTVSVFHSEWIVAKGNTIGRGITSGEASFDFNIGYFGTLLLALCFLVMGTALMFNKGITPAAGATGFGTQLIDMFAHALGTWARIIIAVAALAVMVSTVLAILDGCPRTVARVIQEWRTGEFNADASSMAGLYTVLLIIQVLGGSMILILFLKSFTGFIDFATSVSFLSAPFLAYFNHRAMYSTEVSEELQPGSAMRAWSIIGIILLGVCAGAYVWLGIL
jgi:Mn2+/Fe2+ NRAMP family transporter